MTMFTQSCFIEKSTPELRAKLNELGWIVLLTVGNTIVLDSSIGHAYCGNYSDSQERTGRIDCGTNEQLFLALAALRDDSDYMQWFHSGAAWDLEQRKGRTMKDTCVTWTKATPAELIEHFKKE